MSIISRCEKDCNECKSLTVELVFTLYSRNASESSQGSRVRHVCRVSRHRPRHATTPASIKEALRFVFHICAHILQCLCSRLYLWKSPSNQQKKGKRRENIIILEAQQSLQLGYLLPRNISFQPQREGGCASMSGPGEKRSQWSLHRALLRVITGWRRVRPAVPAGPQLPHVLRFPHCLWIWVDRFSPGQSKANWKRAINNQVTFFSILKQLPPHFPNEKNAQDLFY